MSGLTASGISNAPTLHHLIETAHAQRKQASPRRTLDYRDTEFRTQLAAFALLGEAIFGDIIRVACASSTGPDAARDFRQRLAKLLM